MLPAPVVSNSNSKHIFWRVEEAGTTKSYFVSKFKPLQSQIRFLFFTQKIFCISHFTCSLYEVVWLARFLGLKAMKSSAAHSNGRAGLQLQPALATTHICTTTSPGSKSCLRKLLNCWSLAENFREAMLLVCSSLRLLLLLLPACCFPF